MDIAICALGWNHRDVTHRWLDSVRRNSDGHRVGLYLLDNGSSDDTKAVMDAFDPRYCARNNDNESIYKGWNLLTRQALLDNVEVVCLSNNDLVVSPGWLDAVAREVGRGDARYFLPNGSYSSDGKTAPLVPPAPGTRPARGGWCLFFRADAVRHFLPIPEELQLWYGDDWIHYKLERAGYRCESIDDCLVAHAGSVSFYSRPGYADIVAKDREIFNRLTGLNL